MKLFRITAVLFFMMLMTPVANAVVGAGTVEEVMSCSTGHPNPGWKQALLFKLSDGNWFGVYADYQSTTAADQDSNFAVSMVLTAFTSRLPVSVKFNYQTNTFCGMSVPMFWDTAGDYIKIAR